MRTWLLALMALAPFERACILILHYETLHTVKNWSTIAYGHVVQKGEKFRKRNYSHAEADRMLRSANRDIHHEYTSFSRYKSRHHPCLYRRR